MQTEFPISHYGSCPKFLSIADTNQVYVILKITGANGNYRALSRNKISVFNQTYLPEFRKLKILNMRRTHIARILPANKPMMAIQQVYLGLNYLVNLTINSLSVFANASRISLYMANINDNSAAALTKLKKIQD
ncbi:hypothetical protein TrispH2_012041, partial [Trichoplax sp. H2]